MDLMLERDSAIEHLANALGSARSGAGNVVLVAGEAGIGKTTLVERFVRDHAMADRVLRGGCDALSTPRPLGPLFDMASQLGSAVNDALRDHDRPFRIFSALLGDLAAHRATTLIVIEDAHWADHGTLDLIKYLGRRIAHSCTLLVVTYRNESAGADGMLSHALGELPAASTTRLELGPLSPAAVARLAQQDRRSAVALHALTRGNPFYLTEVLASPEERIPPSVRDTALSRVLSLTKQARAVCELISVIPGTAELELIFHALPDLTHGDNESPIDECLRFGALQVHEGGLRFRHELVRLAVEEALLPGRKLTLHGMVLHWLRARSDASKARLVHHGANADMAEIVLDVAPVAASEATRLGAHREATAHYASAIRFLAHAPRPVKARLLEGWALALCVTGYPDARAINAMEQAIDHWRALGEVERHGAALLRLASMLHATWQRERAMRELIDAIELLQTIQPTAALAECYSKCAHFHMEEANTEAALEWGRKALSLSESLGVKQAYVGALAAMGAALLRRGDEDGVSMLMECRTTYMNTSEELGSLVLAYVYLCECLSRQYRLEQADDHCADALRRFEETGFIQHYFLGLRAQIAMQRGELRLSIAYAAETLERLEIKPTLMQAGLLFASGLARSRSGAEGAEAQLREAYEIGLATRAPWYVFSAATALIEHLAFARRFEEARELLVRTWTQRASDASSWETGLLLVWAARLGVQLDHGDGARHEPASPYRDEINGDYESAAAHWQRLGAPFEQACCLMHCGADGIRRAIDLFARIEARPAERMARAEAHRLGIRGVKRGHYAAVRANPFGLTSRQMQIFHLIVAGYSNAQIAAAMSRSERTVEHHVSRLLAQMGKSNRRELADYAHESGAVDATAEAPYRRAGRLRPRGVDAQPRSTRSSHESGRIPGKGRP